MRRYRLVGELDEQVTCALQVFDWGYERHITAEEIGASAWVRFGDDVIAWFSTPKADPGALQLFLCAAPEARGGIINRETFAVACLIAELLGADRMLFASKLEDSDYEVPAGIERIPREYGYEEHPLGYVFNLANRPQLMEVA